MAHSGYDYFMSRLLEPVDAAPGASGYFSVPTDHLDPRLFPGGSEARGMRPEVRRWLLDVLYGFWGKHYRSPERWSTAWVAGSAISYQWSAARGGVGDVDVLIGVDFPAFFRANPRFLGFSEIDMADIFNSEFKEGLWPKTSHTEIGEEGDPNPIGTGSDLFEVTFYVNPHSTDIRDIKPYAAYDLSNDRWTVHPVEVSDDPAKGYSSQWWDHVEDERRMADSLVSRYNSLAGQAKGQPAESPGWHNTMRMIQTTTAQAQAMFDDIHLGRKRAFDSEGQGYGDFHNFRWQAHKQFGTIQALHQLGQAQQEARLQMQADLYGQKIEGADVMLRRAALWNRGGQ